MRQSKITIVCEDKQQATFIRKFLEKRTRRIHLVRTSQGGAGDQFVRNTYPEQLDAVRKQGGALVIMIDGDKYNIEQRQKQLDEACKQRGVEPRVPSDNVVVLVPRRNIETWFAYLDGEEVDEMASYPKLKRGKECSRHVDALWKMCTRDQRLRVPSPASLEAACHEYRKLTLRTE